MIFDESQDKEISCKLTNMVGRMERMIVIAKTMRYMIDNDLNIDSINIFLGNQTLMAAIHQDLELDIKEIEEKFNVSWLQDYIKKGS